MSELKPCPFCGNEHPEMEYYLAYDSFEFHCHNCGADVNFGRRKSNQPYGIRERSKLETIKKWNRRYPDDRA